MCPVAYYNIIRSQNHKVAMRRRKYAQKHGIRAASRRFQCSRNTVRKWMRRLQNGDSLEDKSRCPDYSPTKVCKEIEKKVIELRKKTRYGPHRLSDWLLRTEGIEISPWTIRNILNRNNLVKKTKRRSTCYPAHWAWEEENPFSLMQADVKDVYDKDTLGTERTTHLSRIGLPRYQWTVLEGQSRLRLMAYSYQLTITCGIAFLVICLEWLRSWGIDCKIRIQTDWGQEFGGDNPHKIQELTQVL